MEYSIVDDLFYTIFNDHRHQLNVKQSRIYKLEHEIKRLHNYYQMPGINYRANNDVAIKIIERNMFLCKENERLNKELDKEK